MQNVGFSHSKLWIRHPRRLRRSIEIVLADKKQAIHPTGRWGAGCGARGR